MLLLVVVSDQLSDTHSQEDAGPSNRSSATPSTTTRELHYDVVGHPRSEYKFAVVMPFHTARDGKEPQVKMQRKQLGIHLHPHHTSTLAQVTLVREYCQGPNVIGYSLPSGCFEPHKHKAIEDCARAELSEEVGGRRPKWVMGSGLFKLPLSLSLRFPLGLAARRAMDQADRRRPPGHRRGQVVRQQVAAGAEQMPRVEGHLVTVDFIEPLHDTHPCFAAAGLLRSWSSTRRRTPTRARGTTRRTSRCGGV